MDDSTVGYGGGIAPRVGILAGKPAKDGKARKRPGHFRKRDQVGRVPTSVQSDANRPPRGGAVDAGNMTGSQ